MKVQFLESVGEIDRNYGRGGWYDTSLPSNDESYIPEGSANYYVRKGMAKIIEADKPEKVKEEVRPLKKPKTKAKKVSTRPV